MLDHSDFPTLGEAPEQDPLLDEYVEFVPLTAEGLNLEEQLLIQYNEARHMIYVANNAPIRERTQALHAATAILAALTRSQAELYSLERIKKIESVLLEVLKEFPDLQKPFLERYELALNA